MSKESRNSYKGSHAGASTFYSLGFIGALIYFIQQSNTIWQFLVGILEAFIWPIILIYNLLKFMQV